MRIGTEVTREQGALSVATVVRLIWHGVRVPLVSILVLLEPAVRFLCSLAMVLGVTAAILFEVSALGARFPFLWMLALSMGFGVVLVLYYALIALLSR